MRSFRDAGVFPPLVFLPALISSTWPELGCHNFSILVSGQGEVSLKAQPHKGLKLVSSSLHLQVLRYMGVPKRKAVSLSRQKKEKINLGPQVAISTVLLKVLYFMWLL